VLLTKKIETTFNLIKASSTISIVSDYLRDKGLHHSAGSWDDLLNKRILPAIEKGDLTEDELVNLLSDLEEYGKQHIFLYKLDASIDPVDFISEERIKNILENLGALDLLDTPKVLDTPQEPTLTDVRWDQEVGGKRSLVIKVVEAKMVREKVGETIDGDREVIEYVRRNVRSLNILRIMEDGDVEVRITSHANHGNYHEELHGFWVCMQPFIDPAQVVNVTVSDAKDYMWQNRKSLSNIIRFSGSKLRNGNGNTIRAAAGKEQSDLSKDDGVTQSIDSFLGLDGYTESSNVYFLQQNPVPVKDIHVIFSGDNNEIAVTMQCSKNDYDYVLRKIKSFK